MKAISCAALPVLFGIVSSCGLKDDTAVKEKENSALLGAGFGINTTTIFVQNLDSARKFYADVLGFDMTEPKNFQKGIYDGTLSASVFLPDYSSLELLAIKDTGLAAKNQSLKSAVRKNLQGIQLYSLSTSSADSTFNWLRTKGFVTDTIRAGRDTAQRAKGWSWDDGGPQWRSLEFKASNHPVYFPGFMEYTGLPYAETQKTWKPYAWRKYYKIDRNGVVGTSSLLIVVNDLKAARNEFSKIGFAELAANDSSVKFKIAYNQQLELMAPRVPGDSLSAFLKNRGPGVYAIRFEVKNYKDTRDSLQKHLPAKAFLTDTARKKLTLLKEYAFGVQLEFIQESKEQAALASIYSFKEDSPLNAASSRYAAATYVKYCALCHGKNREGYAADFAPSLRSHSLMAVTRKPASAYNFLDHTIAYGRAGTAMAPYAQNQGGPLDPNDIELLLEWLYQSSGVKKPVELPAKPISGNVSVGKALYNQHCAGCHGAKGEGVRAPALANPMLLATASDAFIHYTISEGRDSTPMPAFKDSLSKVQINDITAYVRSRASGWNAPENVTIKEPLPKDYILNPQRKAPQFSLRENLYVSAEQMVKAFKDSARMIILDARSKAAWHQTHIPGAVSVPYYEEPDKFTHNLPNDSTLIVVYCACPHAASQKVVKTLRRLGYKHTAILDEGILVWAQRGYPVQFGQDKEVKSKK